MDSNDEYCKKVLIALATVQMKKQTGIPLSEKDRKAERLIATIGKTLERYDETMKIEDVIESKKEKESDVSSEYEDDNINIFDPPPTYNSTYIKSRFNSVDIESVISDDAEGDTLVENWTEYIYDNLQSNPIKWYTCEFNDYTEPSFEDSSVDEEEGTRTSLSLISYDNQVVCNS